MAGTAARPAGLGGDLHPFGWRQRLRDDSVNGDSGLLKFLPGVSVRVYLLVQKQTRAIHEGRESRTWLAGYLTCSNEDKQPNVD